MSTAKVAVTIDSTLLERLDQLVADHVFPSRSEAVQEALKDKLDRMNRTRLAAECAKLDPAIEKAFAEEGMEKELENWPEY